MYKAILFKCFLFSATFVFQFFVFGIVGVFVAAWLWLRGCIWISSLLVANMSFWCSCDKLILLLWYLFWGWDFDSFCLDVFLICLISGKVLYCFCTAVERKLWLMVYRAHTVSFATGGILQPSWPITVRTFGMVFDLCSWVGRSFALSFFPAGDINV